MARIWCLWMCVCVCHRIQKSQDRMRILFARAKRLNDFCGLECGVFGKAIRTFVHWRDHRLLCDKQYARVHEQACVRCGGGLWAYERNGNGTTTSVRISIRLSGTFYLSTETTYSRILQTIPLPNDCLTLAAHI